MITPDISRPETLGERKATATSNAAVALEVLPSRQSQALSAGLRRGAHVISPTFWTVSIQEHR